MVTDSPGGTLHRDAGAALIRSIRDYSHSRNKKALYMDGRAGNEKKLIKFVFVISIYRWSCKTNNLSAGSTSSKGSG